MPLTKFAKANEVGPTKTPNEVHKVNEVGLYFEYMFHVYIIKSEITNQYYYGFTEQNAEDRLKEHNSGKSSYTKKYKPWKLAWSASFTSKKQAQNFEKYLKTPSGHAFSRKRLI